MFSQYTIKSLLQLNVVTGNLFGAKEVLLHHVIQREGVFWAPRVPFKAEPLAPFRPEPRLLSITPATQSIQSIAHTPAAIYFWRAVCEKQRHGDTTPNLYEGKMSRGAETWSGTERPGGGHVAEV